MPLNSIVWGNIFYPMTTTYFYVVVVSLATRKS